MPVRADTSGARAFGLVRRFHWRNPRKIFCGAPTEVLWINRGRVNGQVLVSNYEDLAQRLVLDFAQPYQAFDTPSAQLKRAYDNLEAWELDCGWSKCWNAFYGKAKRPTYEALRRQANVVRRRRKMDARLRAQFISTLEMMRETDEEFFRRQIEAYSAIVGELGGSGSEGG